MRDDVCYAVNICEPWRLGFECEVGAVSENNFIMKISFDVKFSRESQFQHQGYCRVLKNAV